MTLFCCVFALIIGFTVDLTEINRKKDDHPSNFPYTAISFLVGAITSIAAGYIGMKIAVFTNARTTYMCCKSNEVTETVPTIDNSDKAYLDNLYDFFYPDLQKMSKAEKANFKNEGAASDEATLNDDRARLLLPYGTKVAPEAIISSSPRGDRGILHVGLM